jgi:hypothetical protein
VPESKRTIFRHKALQQYEQSRNKTVLPRYVSPPVFVFLWILLGLLAIAGMAAWLGHVPTYVAGSGVVLDPGSTTQQRGNEAVAIIFVPATPSLALRPGLPVQVQIGSTGPQVASTIMTVEPGIVSPSEARDRYALGGVAPAVITQPSVVVTARLGSSIQAQVYAGSIVSAQVQVGTRSILSLLPGLGSLFGG